MNIVGNRKRATLSSTFSGLIAQKTPKKLYIAKAINSFIILLTSKWRLLNNQAESKSNVLNLTNESFIPKNGNETDSSGVVRKTKQIERSNKLILEKLIFI